MTLSDCLEKNGLLPSYVMSPDLYLICGSDQRKLGISLVATTRKAGFSVSHPSKKVVLVSNSRKQESREHDMPLLLGMRKKLKK